jgi:tetratricopeptide (TPR) repeat protein
MRNIKKLCGVVGILTGVVSGFASQAKALTVEQQASVYDSYAFERAGDFSHAMERMVQVFKQSPSDYFVNLRLGYLFYTLKKYKNSADHYERAVQLNTASIEPLLGLTQVYLASETYDKVIKACSSILQKDPRNYTALQRLITSEIRLKDYAHADAHAGEALKLYPTDAIYLEQRAFALKELGKANDAKAILSTLLLVSPQNEYARSQIITKNP